MHRFSLLSLLCPVLLSSTAVAQSAAAHIKMGDKEYAARNEAAALTHYEQAITVDAKNADALWKASRSAVELGEFDDARRDSLYQLGQSYAERAVAVAPKSADAHFALTQALGRVALSVGQLERVKYANKIYEEANTCLKLNPKHPGCLHALGIWNAEVMRLSDFERNMAINAFGGTSLKEATWDNAQHDLEQAIALDPNKAIHHLELGRIYQDRDNKVKAKAQFEAAIKAPSTEYNDQHYKDEASEALKSLES